MKKMRMGLAVAVLAMVATPAMAFPCRVTDFSTRTMASLREEQRLAFVSSMTQTEFARLKAEPAESANHYAFLATIPSLGAAQAAARARLDGLALENTEELRRLWATDYLSDDQLRRFADCSSARAPGLFPLGRRESPTRFHLTFAHITPIGIEKITTRLVASYNIANVKEFEDYLAALGPQDNYTARTFALQVADPARRAVVIMRAGWETPRTIVIPALPEPDLFK